MLVDANLRDLHGVHSSVSVIEKIPQSTKIANMVLRFSYVLFRHSLQWAWNKLVGFCTPTPIQLFIFDLSSSVTQHLRRQFIFLQMMVHSGGKRCTYTYLYSFNVENISYFLKPFDKFFPIRSSRRFKLLLQYTCIIIILEVLVCVLSQR